MTSLPKLYKRCFEGLPKINPILGNGMAYHQQEHFEEFFEHVIRCGAESFPSGLKYVGYKRIPPEEAFTYLTRVHRKRKQFDVAPSDIYYCGYYFDYDGEEIGPLMVAMPFIRRGGIISINGASFVVSPVLEDRLFSVTRDQIYFPLNRGKIILKRIPGTIRVNGEVRAVDLIYGDIHNKKKKTAESGRQTVLAHYLFGRYGVTETFKKFFNCNVEVGTSEITVENYPADKWVICSSYGIRPSSKGYRDYVPTKIRFAIPSEQYTPAVESVIGGFYYVVDREPEIVEVEYLNSTRLWRRLLARFIKLDVDVERKAIEEMDAHYDSLEHYVDDIVRRRLISKGVPAENFYSVLAYLIENFVNLTLHSDPSDMIHDKRLDVARPLLRELITQISRTAFDIMHLKGDRLNKTKVIRTLISNACFPKDQIKRINKDHGEVSVLESATDCLLYSVTKNIVPQSKATSRKQNKRKSAEMRDPVNKLSATQAVVNTFQFITKGDPTGRSSINHFMEINDDGTIIMDAELEATIKEVAKGIEVK